MKTWILFFLLPFFIFAEEKPFVIVTRFHNSGDQCTSYLDSLFKQRYSRFRIICISDGSTDGSDLLIDNYIRNNRREERVFHLKNRVEKGRTACACQAIFSCHKEEIILPLESNDYLDEEGTLSALNEIYADPNVWLTEGTTPQPTFYAALFQSIKKEDFLEEGKFLSSVDNLPYLASLQEMAKEHTHCPTMTHVPIESVSPPLSELCFAAVDPHSPQALVYRQISDIFNPTLDDYRRINDYLLYGHRPNMDRLDEVYGYRQATIQLIGNTPDQTPASGLVHVNCNEEEKENCILLYCTYNRNLPRGLNRLLEAIKDSEFHGDILYRMGGWPDEQGGSLLLSHVPYAFKPCFFKEAQRMGYKRVLWLDASVVPVANLNDIFEMIREKGFFVMGNIPPIGPFMTSQSAVYFGLTLEETHHIPSCSSGLFGIDLTQQKGSELLDRWYRAACDPDAFYTPRADQNVLSILLHQFGISDFIPIQRMPHAEIGEPIQSDSLFYLDRMFTKE